MIEILAPVGGREQLLAAVRCGADAVYLGAKGFNARRNAENFEDASLGETVVFCHARNVRVHVTLNTLVMDSETDALDETIRSIAESGADAVIVQDLAVAEPLGLQQAVGRGAARAGNLSRYRAARFDADGHS